MNFCLKRDRCLSPLYQVDVRTTRTPCTLVTNIAVSLCCDYFQLFYAHGYLPSFRAPLLLLHTRTTVLDRRHDSGTADCEPTTSQSIQIAQFIGLSNTTRSAPHGFVSNFGGGSSEYNIFIVRLIARSHSSPKDTDSTDYFGTFPSDL